MRDMTDIVRTIKKSSKGVQDSSKPCNLVYGTVESISPLKIRVDQKLLLEEEQLKLTKAVMDYEVEITLDNVRKKYQVHNPLIIGDRVTMIRAHGGQQFLIIDKEVIE